MSLTTLAQPRPRESQYPFEEKGYCDMDKKIDPENLGITAWWLTVKQASEVMRVTINYVQKLCGKNRLRCLKVGNVWYIHPEAANAYKRGQHRQPPEVKPD